MSRFHEPDGSSRAEYAVWHVPQLSIYVCGGMRRRFWECFLYLSCSFGKPDDSAEQKARESPKIPFFHEIAPCCVCGWLDCTLP